jgi:hypothetical protein
LAEMTLANAEVVRNLKGAAWLLLRRHYFVQSPIGSY